MRIIRNFEHIDVSDLRLDYYWLWDNLCKKSSENFLNDGWIIRVWKHVIRIQSDIFKRMIE